MFFVVKVGSKKVEECVPYEDNEGIYYDDPEWTSDDFRWKVED